MVFSLWKNINELAPQIAKKITIYGYFSQLIPDLERSKNEEIADFVTNQ
jgi:hypothetical protein